MRVSQFFFFFFLHRSKIAVYFGRGSRVRSHWLMNGHAAKPQKLLLLLLARETRERGEESIAPLTTAEEIVWKPPTGFHDPRLQSRPRPSFPKFRPNLRRRTRTVPFYRFQGETEQIRLQRYTCGQNNTNNNSTVARCSSSSRDTYKPMTLYPIVSFHSFS
jgi:hypothetical protein